MVGFEFVAVLEAVTAVAPQSEPVALIAVAVPADSSMPVDSLSHSIASTVPVEHWPNPNYSEQESTSS